MFSARKRTRRFFPPSMEMPAEYAAPLGFGRWNKKRKAPPIDLQAAGPSSDFEIKGLALAGGFGHTGSPLSLTTRHVVGGDIFHVRGHAPGMPERVVEFSVAVPPEHVCNWHGYFAVRGDRAVEHRVHVFRVEEQIDRIE